MTRRRWEFDFEQVAAQIPEHWLVHGEDGFVGISPEHSDTSLARLYSRLTSVGYACGWL